MKTFFVISFYGQPTKSCNNTSGFAAACCHLMKSTSSFQILIKKTSRALLALLLVVCLVPTTFAQPFSPSPSPSPCLVQTTFAQSFSPTSSELQTTSPKPMSLVSPAMGNLISASLLTHVLIASSSKPRNQRHYVRESHRFVEVQRTRKCVQKIPAAQHPDPHHPVTLGL